MDTSKTNPSFGAAEYEEEGDLELDEKKSDSLLKYDENYFDITKLEYVPPRPYYLTKNHNFFHPEITSASLVAHNTDKLSRHHHHRFDATARGGSGGSSKDPQEEIRNTEMMDVLEILLPHRDFIGENGKCFRKRVSGLPATEAEVNLLTDKVEERVIERCAREAPGYCPIRREIFTQCFDEILRQVVIEDPLMGILLGRVRDEIRMTLGCYRTLIQSMETYGSRKSTQAETYSKEIERISGDSNMELVELRKKYDLLNFEYKLREIKYINLHEAELKKRQEDVDFYKALSTQLTQQLDRILAKV